MLVIQLSEGHALPTSKLKDSGNPLGKAVFYYTSPWKIVFSYVCLGSTFLLKFILFTQFFVDHIQVTQSILFQRVSWDITRFSWLYLAAPLSTPPYLQPHATFYRLEL